jgi:uncharacterized protein (TIGR03435 family)
MDLLKKAAAVGAVAIGLAFPVASRAQRQVSGLPAFDTASVQSHDLEKFKNAGMHIEPGRVTGTNVTLKTIIQEAYDVKSYQISGGPLWVDSERFDLEGKAESAASDAQLKPMLQTLLASRFKLALHRKTDEVRVYALVVGKDGSKLREIKEGDPQPFLTERANNKLFASGAISGNLSQFAEFLSVPIGRPVLDQTGLHGVYDTSMNLDLANQDFFAAAKAAMEEKLGLTLEPTRAPVEILFIDHAEKPSGK